MKTPGSKFTRYFKFTRVYPRTVDYDRLVDICNRIDAWTIYKTTREGVVVRLVGFIALRGPRTVAADIGRLLPNFLVTVVSPKIEDMEAWLLDDECEIFFNGIGHPFEDIKKKLF